MMRLLRAFIWLHWRIMMNSFKGARQRDALERFSRFANVAAPIILGLLFSTVTIVLAVISFRAGVLLGAGELRAEAIFSVLTVVVLGAVGSMVMITMLNMSNQTAAYSTDAILLLPVSRPFLHLLEAASGLMHPLVLFLVPAILALPAGLMASSRWVAGVGALVSGVLLLAAIASLATLVRFLLQWFMRDKGRSEMAGLIVVGLILVLSILSPMLKDLQPGAEGQVSGESEENSPGWMASLTSMPTWMLALPPQLHGHAVRSILENQPAGFVWSIILLCMEAALLYALSASIHSRLLASPASISSRGRKATSRAFIKSLPGISTEALAVAQVQVRGTMRTARGKLAVYLAGAFAILLSLAANKMSGEIPAAAMLFDEGAFIAGAGLFMSLLSLQPILVNQFASDRNGLVLQFISPLSDLSLIRGKALGGAFLLALSALPCITAAILISPGGSLLMYGAVLLSIFSIYCLMAPISVVLSAMFPKSSDLSNIGQGGNAHTMAGLIAFVLTVVIAAPPGFVTVMFGKILGRPGLALLLVFLWTGMAALALPWLLKQVAGFVADRRENLALVAQGK